MGQTIIDMGARKAKDVICPHCNRTNGVSLNNYDGEYECRYCDTVFDLNEDETHYDEDFDEEWRDLTEDELIMLGEDIDDYEE